MLKVFYLAVAIFVCTGCSSFNRDWRKMPPEVSSYIEGRWEGTWQSDSPGHAGRLRCLLTKVEEGKYEAKFHAKYKKVLGFGYTAILDGNTEAELFKFSGEADLGKLAGGIYRYDGKISPTNFFSTYKSKYDNGTLTLRRGR